jgi:hypothetical protein
MFELLCYFIYIELTVLAIMRRFSYYERIQSEIRIIT